MQPGHGSYSALTAIVLFGGNEMPTQTRRLPMQIVQSLLPIRSVMGLVLFCESAEGGVYAILLLRHIKIAPPTIFRLRVDYCLCRPCRFSHRHPVARGGLVCVDGAGVPCFSSVRRVRKFPCFCAALSAPCGDTIRSLKGFHVGIIANGRILVPTKRAGFQVTHGSHPLL